MEDVNISKFRAQVVRAGSTPASPGFVVSEGQNPVDPSGSGQNHLPVTIGSPANGLAVTDAQILTIDKAQIFAGTSSQFVKGDGTLDSTAYGTGSVTSVALTMPTAFSVANSPVTTAGTLAVTATGTTAQYIRGDGSLATFPGLTGFVPYTGATADVNLGTHDLAAERGTFENNGSSDTLTVNHTSGSGYGIIVTKGGANEALYVSKTSGSGNAMTVVGGRTSLVDLALSSVTNTAGDFLTLSGGVVHKRTAAQTLTDIGGQAALTNPVTGTGTSGQVAYFNGTTTITSESNLFWDSTNDRLGIGTNTPSLPLEIIINSSATYSTSSRANSLRVYNINGASNVFAGIELAADGPSNAGVVGINGVVTGTGNGAMTFYTRDSSTFSEKIRIASTGNLLVGTTTDAGFKLDVNGTGRFTNTLTPIILRSTNANTMWTEYYYNTSTLSGYIGSGSGLLSGANASDFIVRGEADFVVASGGNNRRLTIASTGAATFSSSVTSDGLFRSNQGILQIFAAGGFRGGVYNYASWLGSGTDYSPTLASETNIYFATAGTITRQMTITSGGNVLIGTTTDSGARLQVSGTSTFSGQITVSTNNGIVVGANGRAFIREKTGGDAEIGAPLNGALFLLANGSNVLSFSGGSATFSSLGTGSVTATAGTLSTTSDMSYKIDDGFIYSAIEKVLNLKPRYFYWNEKSGLPKDVRQLGFYAQEVNEALGEEAANTPQNKNTPWGISDRSMIAMLTKAIQELKQEIDTLKN
jgi:hypothetical protein